MIKIEVVDNGTRIENILEALEKLGLQIKSVKRPAKLEGASHQGGEGCCGKKQKATRVAPPIPTFKDKLMAWSYKHISECQFCGGMRIGVVLTASLWIIKEIIVWGG